MITRRTALGLLAAPAVVLLPRSAEAMLSEHVFLRNAVTEAEGVVFNTGGTWQQLSAFVMAASSAARSVYSYNDTSRYAQVAEFQAFLRASPINSIVKMRMTVLHSGYPVTIWPEFSSIPGFLGNCGADYTNNLNALAYPNYPHGTLHQLMPEVWSPAGVSGKLFGARMTMQAPPA